MTPAVFPRWERKRDARAGAWIRTLTLLVLLTVAGIVSEGFWHGRADLTRDRRFTLGPAAIRALQGLPDKVTVRVIMSRDLPPRFAQARLRAVDVLEEFQARANGRLELIFEDPGQDTAARATALSLGMEEVVLREESRGGVRAKKGFFGLALLYGEKRNVFPVLQNVETFEYDLVVALKRLTGSAKTVGIVEGSAGNRFRPPSAAEGAGDGDGPSASSGFDANFSVLKARIEPLYRVVKQGLADSSPDPRVDLLLIPAPTRLTSVEKFRIDQYLMAGKPVIFLTPGVNVNVSGGIEAAPAEDGYGDFLAHYGVKVGTNPVLESRSFERARFGDAEFPVPYPYWVAVSFRSLNGDNPITASLPSLSFPWTGAVHLDTAAQPGARFEVLASTSDRAWEQGWAETKAITLYPRRLDAYHPAPWRRFPLAVLVTGSLTSYYAAFPDSVPPELRAENQRPRSREDARLLVISNALFVSDFYADYIPAENNLHLVLNAIDQLALDPDLIRVRSRQLTDRPLDQAVVARFKGLILAVNMLFAPLLAVLAGIFVNQASKRTRA